jgi:hypothetical protein
MDGTIGERLRRRRVGGDRGWRRQRLEETEGTEKRK